jgi:hypothetical protein
LAAKACQRRSSYTVPGSRAVISQAAVTRLASLKRGPINADSLGENLGFRKSADVKKVSNGPFQQLDLGEITFLDFPFRMKESRK